mmetsp:Transcript_20329/g.78083  ORF Transcript_20329/g.78083 Transcript_20329/m.78083 type:complete len:223 (+) Transcript_20329:1697-2365(+)
MHAPDAHAYAVAGLVSWLRPHQPGAHHGPGVLPAKGRLQRERSKHGALLGARQGPCGPAGSRRCRVGVPRRPVSAGSCPGKHDGEGASGVCHPAERRVGAGPLALAAGLERDSQLERHEVGRCAWACQVARRLAPDAVVAGVRALLASHEQARDAGGPERGSDVGSDLHDEGCPGASTELQNRDSKRDAQVCLGEPGAEQYRSCPAGDSLERGPESCRLCGS